MEKGADDWNSSIVKGGHNNLVLFFIEEGTIHWDWATEGGHNGLVTLLKKIKQLKERKVYEE